MTDSFETWPSQDDDDALDGREAPSAALATFMATDRLDRVLRRALGHVRVSSTGQAIDGRGLEHQERAIRDYADRHGFILEQIYRDVGSAWDADSWLKRGGLQQILREARARGLPIVAQDASRMTRHAGTHQRLHGDPELELLYVDDDRLIAVPSHTPDAAVLNQLRAERVSEGTRRGMAARAAEGATFGTLATLSRARERSVDVRQDKAARTIDEIVAYLRRNPDAETWTARTLVDALNAEGLRSGRGLPWTLEGIRRPLSKAREVLAVWRELDDLLEDLKPFPAPADNKRSGMNDDAAGSGTLSEVPLWGRF